jgi:hypothetical protein
LKVGCWGDVPSGANHSILDQVTASASYRIRMRKNVKALPYPKNSKLLKFPEKIVTIDKSSDI